MEPSNDSGVCGSNSNKIAIKLALDEIQSQEIVTLRRNGKMMPELSAIVNAFVQAVEGVKPSEFRGLLRVEGYAGTDRRCTRR